MSLEEKYKKEDLQNHIYNTPDTYVGGCDLIVEQLQVFEPSKNKIINKECEYIPALFKAKKAKINFIVVRHRKREYGKSNYGTIDRLIKGIIDLIKVLKIIKLLKN